MDALHHACTLNNTGVSLLLSGDHVNGVASFQTALSLMKTAAADLNLYSQERADNVSRLYNILSCPKIETKKFSSKATTDATFVYDIPFLLTCENDVAMDDLRTSFYSAVMLFNLALALHKQGQQGKENSLARALQLYHFCVQLLEEPMLAHPEVASILAVVALNNMANIHYELCNYADSRHCAADIFSLLITETSRYHHAFTSDVIDELILNSSFMLNLLPTGAHAA